MPVVLVKSIHLNIPSAIRPLITERHILSSENPKHYDDLLRILAEAYQPQNALQWLGIKRLQDLLWDQQRLNRIKPNIIETARKEALKSLLVSININDIVDLDALDGRSQAEMDATAWFIDPAAKLEILATLQKFNLSENSIDAMAFVLRSDALKVLESMQISNEARQYEVFRQLEPQHGEPPPRQLAHGGGNEDMAAVAQGDAEPAKVG